MSKSQTLQDPFLNALRKDRIPVSVFYRAEQHHQSVGLQTCHFDHCAGQKCQHLQNSTGRRRLNTVRPHNHKKQLLIAATAFLLDPNKPSAMTRQDSQTITNKIPPVLRQRLKEGKQGTYDV